MHDGELNRAPVDVHRDDEVTKARLRTTKGGAGPLAGSRDGAGGCFGAGPLVDQVRRGRKGAGVAARAAGSLADVTRIANQVGAEDVEVLVLIVVIDDFKDVELPAPIGEPPFGGVLGKAVTARKGAGANQLARI